MVVNGTTTVNAKALRDLNSKLEGLIELKRNLERLGYDSEPAVMEWYAKVETAIKTEALTLLEEQTD